LNDLEISHGYNEEIRSLEALIVPIKQIYFAYVFGCEARLRRYPASDMGEAPEQHSEEMLLGFGSGITTLLGLPPGLEWEPVE
jgi:hypothetical protein